MSYRVFSLACLRRASVALCLSKQISPLLHHSTRLKPLGIKTLAKFCVLAVGMSHSYVSANSAPVISMGPTETVIEAEQYRSKLIATDSDGDPLNWKIKDGTSLPAWLSLETRAEVSTIAGSGKYGIANNLDPLLAQFKTTWGITVNSTGELFVGEYSDFIIRKVSHVSGVTTHAGSGVEGSSDGAALAATFGKIRNLATDSLGNVYVSDDGSNKIRRIDAITGDVTTFAGSGSSSSSDNTDPLLAGIGSPYGIAVDTSNNVYVSSNSQIRRIDGITKEVTTLAGSTAGFADGTGSNAKFSNIQGISSDSSGNIYVVDTGNERIRKVTTLGAVSTIAGSGVKGFSDHIDPLQATFDSPIGITLDGTGNIFVLDYANQRIRRLDAITGEVTTYAGNGSASFADNSNGLEASFRNPTAITSTRDGRLYVTDWSNKRIRSVIPTTMLTGEPANADLGDHNICFVVSDGVAESEQCLTVTVESNNAAPTAIALSNSHLVEGYSNNGIGTLTTIDSDNPAASSFSYTLVSGSGDTHNGLFSIAGDRLIAQDYSTLIDESYSVRVSTDDGQGGVYSQALLITVQRDSDGDGVPDSIDSDVNNPSVFVDSDNDGISDYQETHQTQFVAATPRVVNVIENTRDVITVKTLNHTTAPTFQVVSGIDADLFEINSVSGKLSFIDKPDWDIPGDANTDNEYHLSIKVTDNKVDLTWVQNLTVVVIADPDEIEAGDSRSDTRKGEVFLGGKFIELGISQWGDFGTENAKPTGFFGTSRRSNIGMSNDLDGFGVGEELSMDFFLPGTPEERFVLGYQGDDGTSYMRSNSAMRGAKSLSTTVQDISNLASKTLGAKIKSTWEGKLLVQQKVSFEERNNFFRNEVTISNISNESLDNVRYMRSFDPDNTADQGGSYSTENQVLYSRIAGDDKEVVQASTYKSEDPLFIKTGSKSPIFLYSKDENVRVSIFGFANTNPFDPFAWDVPVAKGTVITADKGMTLTYKANTLAANESIVFVYYTGLDGSDFDKLEEVIKEDEESKGEPKPEPIITVPVLKIDGAPTDITAQGMPYSFEPIVTNPESLTLSFVVENLPSWLSFNNATGELYGTPAQADIGAHPDILIKVISTLLDGTELEDSIVPFTIVVNNTNDAPYFSGNLTPSITGQEGQALSYTPALFDLDSPDVARFSVDNLPVWAEFDITTGMISATPSYIDSGEFLDIRIWAHDAAGERSTNEITLSITIENVNRKPTYTGKHLFEISRHTRFVAVIDAEDIDGDIPRYSLYDVKSGDVEVGLHTDLFTIDADSGELSFIVVPDFNYADGNVYKVTVMVDDFVGGVSISPLEVKVINHSPVISGVPATKVAEGSRYSFIPEVSDVDNNDTLVFSVSGLPSWLTLNTGNGAITGTSSNDDVGMTSEILLSVSDGVASASLASFSIEVINVNDAPAVEHLELNIDEDGSGFIDILAAASDIDPGDILKIDNISASIGAVSIVEGKVQFIPPANFSGVVTINYCVSDISGVQSCSEITVKVKSVDDLPIIDGVSASNVLEGERYHFTPTVTNLDNLALSFAVANLPAWLNFDSATGQIFGVPGQADVGIHNNILIKLISTLSDGNQVEANMLPFSIKVNNINDAPVVEHLQLNIDEDGSALIDVLATASDIDLGDILKIENVSTDIGAVSIVERKVLFIPPANFSGEVTINFCVSDISGAQSCSFATVIVKPVNDLPEISGSPTTEILEGDIYHFTPIITDVDGDELKVSVQNLPAWLVFDLQTLTLTGIPVFTDVGLFQDIRLTVSDTLLSAILPPFNITVIAKDSDGDGIADGDELLCGLDPQNADDANRDSDGDGMVNAEECYAGQDPFIDDIAPELTIPEDIFINSTGLFTKVDLGVATAIDYIDGVMLNCCEPQPKSLIDGKPLFAPGTNEVIWQAVDATGNVTEKIQYVHVEPLVSLSKDQSSIEGSAVVIGVHLNGESPSYPVTIPYEIAGTAGEDDHDLISGKVIIESGVSANIYFNILSDQINFEGDESIEIGLTEHNNLGNKKQHKIMIVERNIPPTVTLQAFQGNSLRSVVSLDGGDIKFRAIIEDLNFSDKHTITWSGAEFLLEADDATTEMDINSTSLELGILKIEAVVKDDGAPSFSTQVSLRLKVVSTLELLSSSDTDRDGISDIEEGFSDNDMDGIPDYLDAIEEKNVLPERVAQQNGFIVECEAGLSCRLGSYSLFSEHQGAELSMNDISMHDNIMQDSFVNVGGIFDFEIHELPHTGDSASLVLPQVAAIPDNAVYRKFMNGEWKNFIFDSRNLIRSASGEPGYCPPPGSDVYLEGLNAGDWCVELTIQDGGPNDYDGLANGTIIDPGGVAMFNEAKVKTSSSGGSFSWLGIFALSLLALGRRISLGHRGVVVVIMSFLPISLASASEVSQREERNWFITVDLGRVTSATNIGRINQAVDGMNAQIVALDDERAGWKLGVGYQFNDFVALNLEYVELGKVDIELAGSVADLDKFYRLAGSHHPVSGQGPAASVLLSVPITDEWDIYSRLGVMFWEDSYLSFNEQSKKVASDKSHGRDLYYGVGFSWKLNEKIVVKAEWQQIQLEDKGEMLSIGVKYML
ncbi:MAG: streptogramin lyase [Shewanella sp.]|jgi:streptogramin lyase